MPRNIEEIIEELMDQYQEEDRYNRPWIIGFSGGKDSTVLLTLTWLALQRLKEQGKKSGAYRKLYRREASRNLDGRNHTLVVIS